MAHPSETLSDGRINELGADWGWADEQGFIFNRDGQYSLVSFVRAVLAEAEPAPVQAAVSYEALIFEGDDYFATVEGPDLERVKTDAAVYAVQVDNPDVQIYRKELLEPAPVQEVVSTASRSAESEREASEGYQRYRGRCLELSQAAVALDPTLRLVRGHYYCPVWNVTEQHWWTVDDKGKVYDPTREQYPSGGLGTYTEFDGNVTCEQCGVIVKEENAYLESRYAFCSSRCFGRFVGVG